MRDFTIKVYLKLLQSLQNRDYLFQTFSEFLNSPDKKSIILRHDVDRLPESALKFAKIQATLGIRGSYYFRVVPGSWDEEIIKRIHGFGHEIGYHYETMDSAYLKYKGYRKNLTVEMGSSEYEKLIDSAFTEFSDNLEKFRKLVNVETICMHGSPRSEFDNRVIWSKYDYKSLGILGEPYLDIDFDEVFYLTDTGRRWDGWNVSIRDKIPRHQIKWCSEGLSFKSTQEIIEAANLENLPDKIMITQHPQRWDDAIWPWFKELVLQKLKNAVKSSL